MPDVPKMRYVAYPKPQETKNTQFKKGNDTNPVLRGTPLVYVSWLVSSIGAIQNYLWSNAGFNSLRKLHELSDWDPRFDPTVIPLSNGSEVAIDCTNLDAFKSLPSGISGRYYSAADYHRLYLSGEATPLDVAQSLLPLVRRDLESKSIHSTAFINSEVDLVLQAAKESTERYKLGKSLGVLDGVPTAVKDETDLAGYRTYFGRKKDDKVFEVKSKTAWSVLKWQEAGAVIVGKTTMHELGDDTTNLNPNWGTPRNPFNKDYYTGGSSGGSAYAVATGLVPFAFGADAGGSIRLPAAFCGVYGLKPSQGRVAETSLTMCVQGPIAATISDLELAYRVMGKPEPDHPIGSLFSPPKPFTGPRPKIMGIFEPWFNRADPEVLTRCNQVKEYMVKVLGYEVVSIELPYLPEGQLAHAATTLSEMSTILQMQFPGRPWLTDLTAATKILALVGAQTPAYDYILAQRLRNLLMSHLSFLWKKYPGLVIITPTTPMAGWPIEKESDLKYGVSDGNSSIRNMEYIWLANTTGCPAIACPIGYVEPKSGKGKGELPVSIMAMGEWGAEDALIEWGRDVEKWLIEDYPGGRRHPASWVDVFANAKAKTNGT